MQSHDVPLSVHESCHNVGTELTDTTIGEFISGFWSYHTETSGSNWIKVRSSPIDKRRCEGVVEIYRRHGEEIIGGWGVSFIFDSKNRKVDRASIRCLGSG
jgi:hypothetical protein